MTENNTERQNPFFVPYGTPHDTVPFDRIRLEDFEPAFMEGIRRDNEQIEKTINNPAKPTFDNTIIDKDDKTEGYYDLLERVSTVFFNLLSAETNDEMDALAQKIQPILTQHANDVRLNERLFERIKYVHRHHRKLTPEEKMLLENTYQGFVRSGALLDKEGKERLRQLTEEASILGLQFSQNLQKEQKAFTLTITDPTQLDGLPQTAIDAAAEEFVMRREENGERRENAGWTFTLDYPSYQPFMTYSTQRELRRQMYMARNTICTHDNSENNIEICKRLVNLRREIAQLLGYKTYADYVLKRRMASNTRNVYKLLNDLIDAYRPTAEKEYASLIELMKREEKKESNLSPLSTLHSPLSPLNSPLISPWDTAFYSHKLQMKKYNLDAEMLRPYFQLEKVIDGVFGLANRLYGITFKENSNIPVYHPDVKAYEVFDRDGSYLAVFYADFHPRKGKQGGAWMTEFQGQSMKERRVESGERRENSSALPDCKSALSPHSSLHSPLINIRPHVSVVMNVTKPTAEKPALLTLSEVETFLHEFGHSLHGMFANTRFESLSGTNVWWDFVELPSQFMENYSVEKEFLRTFAFHYQTGEPLPDELINRIVKSRNFMAATACLRQVSFGLLDMAYYTQRDEFNGDILSFEKQAWKKAILGPQLPDTCMTVQFSHIMAGGYAAGYYSYKWAEVLDADAFSVFKKNGIFDQKTAQSFRDNILSRGGTEHPMTLYKRFRGQEPTIDALLKRNGIKRRKK